MTDYLERFPLLDEVNRKTLTAYIRKQEIKQLQPSSIKDKAWRVCYLLKTLKWKDARDITKEDIEDYI
ncbi:MAG: integrase, partial [Methanomicrobiales archaeon]